MIWPVMLELNILLKLTCTEITLRFSFNMFLVKLLPETGQEKESNGSEFFDGNILFPLFCFLNRSNYQILNTHQILNTRFDLNEIWIRVLLNMAWVSGGFFFLLN